MKIALVAGGVLLWASTALGQGMSIDAYHYLTTKSGVTMSEVLKKAGPPDLIREDAFGRRVRLYYMGETQDYESRRNTTVFVDGTTDRVIRIERIR